jgi:hypothetical protein
MTIISRLSWAALPRALDRGFDARYLLARLAAGRPGRGQSDRGFDRALVDQPVAQHRITGGVELGERLGVDLVDALASQTELCTNLLYTGGKARLDGSALRGSVATVLCGVCEQVLIVTLAASRPRS